MNNKGYTLVNMLVTLTIMGMMLTLTLKNTYKINTEHLEFINAYLNTQVDALTQRNNLVLEEDNSVYFNENGHVNKGQTVHVGKKDVIIHLGNGYITYEQ